MSKTALTVTEEDTTGDSYTVVLDSQPTANVVVTVAGHSGTAVTPTSTTLTFTDTDWSTPQTVTVTAATDSNTADETVSLTHSAASTDTDYEGITIAGVTVMVQDNDTEVSISADKTSAVFKEDGITYTLTRTGATTGALPVSVTLTQDQGFPAAADLTETVTIAAGQSTNTFTVAASSFEHFAAGTLVEAGTLTATVQDGTDYDLGTPSAVNVAIVIGVMVRLDMASYTVGEAAGTLSFEVIARTGAGAPQPSAATGSINVFTVDGSASNGVDIRFTDAAENFLPGEFSADGGVWQAESTYNVPITNDDRRGRRNVQFLRSSEP